MNEQQIDQWDRQEEDKRRSLNFTMAVIITWITITVQLMLPKSEVRAISVLETRLIGINVLSLFIILVFLVYKIEGDLLQVMNYAYFYILYVALHLPHYEIPAEVFIPSWMGGVVFYILLAAYSDSTPFLQYPQREFPSYLKRGGGSVAPQVQRAEPLPGMVALRPKFLMQDENKTD